MWTDEDLRSAVYIVFHENESFRPLNVGTFDVRSNPYQGPYVMTPVPPFGSLNVGDGVAPLGISVRVPLKNLSIDYSPKSWPLPTRDNPTVLHQYGDGTV